ncbi:hypothetical protein ABW19_dt0204149 [Dactylella cylindrospora]|nr:hypothetical protein ABW19_dt0204149 [Dactylella cylindrospora]
MSESPLEAILSAYSNCSQAITEEQGEARTGLNDPAPVDIRNEVEKRIQDASESKSLPGDSSTRVIKEFLQLLGLSDGLICFYQSGDYEIWSAKQILEYNKPENASFQRECATLRQRLIDWGVGTCKGIVKIGKFQGQLYLIELELLVPEETVPGSESKGGSASWYIFDNDVEMPIRDCLFQSVVDYIRTSVLRV